ncbi:hypothetical protein JCM8097_000568 [Rhodosporidiobolus ruineniae]
MSPAGSIQAIVDASTRIADSFTTRYYTAADLAPLERAQQLPTFYAPTARISWNGNPIGADALAAFAQSLPESVHEVQAFDCHPVSGSAAGSNPPSLVVTVSGQVSHGSNPTPSAGSINSKNFDNLPRVFSQSFILVFSEEAAATGRGEQGYLVASDSFRFC